MNKKKCLIIGACGFLMSNFIRKSLFKNENYSFVSIDKFSSPQAINNYYVHKYNQLYVGDATDFHFLKNVIKLEKPEIVVFNISPKDAVSASSTLIGLSNIINLCDSFEFEKIVYISSQKIYNKEDDFYLSSFDGSINRAAELLLIQSKIKSNWILLRTSNIFGPRQSKNSFLPKIIQNILLNSTVSINEKSKKDYLHVDDFCSALSLILFSYKGNQIYDIVSGIQISDLEIEEQLNSFFSKIPKNTICPVIKHESNYCDENLCELDESLIELGWKPNLNIKEQIYNVTNWYYANRWWFDL